MLQFKYSRALKEIAAAAASRASTHGWRYRLAVVFFCSFADIEEYRRNALIQG
jgi:hypothetical protein